MTRQQKYYSKNRDKARRCTKEWKKNNPEKVKEHAEKYRKENPDCTKNWRKKNKKHIEEYENTPERKKYKRKQRRIASQKILTIKKEKGNKCSLCGYDKEIRILQFHHLKDKKFEISRAGYKKIEDIRNEAKKCILLCPNCHALIHLIN